MVMLMGVAFWASPAAAHGHTDGFPHAEAPAEPAAPVNHAGADNADIADKADMERERHDCAHDCDCPGDCSGGCANGCHFTALALPAMPMIARAPFARPSWTTRPSSPPISPDHRISVPGARASQSG